MEMTHFPFDSQISSKVWFCFLLSGVQCDARFLSKHDAKAKSCMRRGDLSSETARIPGTLNCYWTESPLFKVHLKLFVVSASKKMKKNNKTCRDRCGLGSDNDV